MEETQSLDLLSLENITYRHGRLHILNNLNFSISAGEIHTLLYSSPEAARVLRGIFTCEIISRSYFGNVYWEGEPLNFTCPRVPLKLGIIASHGRPLILQEASVQENIFLAREGSDDDSLIDADLEESLTWNWIDLFKLPFTPNTIASDINEDFYPTLEVIRILNHPCKLLVLQQSLIDSLSHATQEILRNFLVKKTREGLALLYLCTNPIFLWDHSYRTSQMHRGEIELKWITETHLSKETVGNRLAAYNTLTLPRIEKQEEYNNAFLSFLNWESDKIREAGEQKLYLHCYEGDMLALGGLNPHNQRQLVEILAGKTRLTQPENLLLRGEPLLFNSPTDAIENRMAVIPENSLLVEEFNLQENLLLKLQNYRLGLLTDETIGENLISETCERYDISLPPCDKKICDLSVMETQMVLLVQALLTDPIFFLLENPTLYLNEQDKSTYFELLGRIAKRGVSVLLLMSSLWDFSLLQGRKLWMTKEQNAEDWLKRSLDPLNKQGNSHYGT